MEEVIISPLVLDKLESLVQLLFEKEYFSYWENADAYVDDIIDFILSIPNIKKKQTKKSTHGAWYCWFTPNRHTTWFVCFDFKNEVYIIKNIINNHGRDYPAFIRGIK